MKKFRRSVCLIIAFVFCTLTVTGCALFERDVEYYNNMVVATVGQDIKIKKKELINAYNSFGYQYVQNGDTKKKALEQTLNLLIDREIVIELSIQNFSEFKGVSAANRAQHIKNLRKKSGMDGLFYQALNDNEKAKARKSAFESMDENVKELEKKVREERKMSDVVSESPNDDAASDTQDKFNKYEAYIVRKSNNTVFTLDVSKYASQETYFAKDTDPSSPTFGEMVSTVPMTWTQKVRASGADDAREKAIAEEAYARLVRNLSNSEKGLSFKKNKDSDIVDREINRLIDGYSKNILYERLKNCFEQGISKPIDRTSLEFQELAKQYGGDTEKAYIASLPDQSSRVDQLVNQAVSYYKSQVKTQINRYQKGLETDESLGSKVLESLADVYWMPNSIIDNYFTVSHILIGYSEEQTAAVSKKKEEYKLGSLSEQAFQDWLDTLTVMGTERDEEGNEKGAPRSAAAILAELNGRLDELSESNADKRISTFREYIYKYNTDPGMINPEYEYVMGINDSKMVEQFTNASRELYGYENIQKTVNGETTYEWKKTSTPIRSAMSELVMTEHGAHIIMYTRPLRDFIYTSTIETEHNNYQKFLFAPLTSYGDVYANKSAVAKTYFDSIVEKLSKPAYDNYEQRIISTYKQERSGDNQNGKLMNKITIFKGNYRDLT